MTSHESVHLLEVGAGPDVECANAGVLREDVRNGDVATEPGQASDQRHVAAVAEGLKRADPRFFATDVDDVLNAEPVGERQDLLLPLGIRYVVHRSDGAEIPGAGELLVTRAGDDGPRAGGGREEEPEAGDTPGSLEQHVVTGNQA